MKKDNVCRWNEEGRKRTYRDGGAAEDIQGDEPLLGGRGRADDDGAVSLGIDDGLRQALFHTMEVDAGIGDHNSLAVRLLPLNQFVDSHDQTPRRRHWHCPRPINQIIIPVDANRIKLQKQRRKSSKLEKRRKIIMMINRGGRYPGNVFRVTTNVQKTKRNRLSSGEGKRKGDGNEGGKSGVSSFSSSPEGRVRKRRRGKIQKENENESPFFFLL